MIMLQTVKIIGALLFLSQVFAAKDKQKEVNFNFFQNDYKMKIEHMELVSYNKSYTDVQVKTFKYNRTCTAFNITSELKVDLDNKLEVVVQAYKFASNEYRLFPMRFQINVCDCYNKNFLGLTGTMKCGNFGGCPIKKGKIEICNFTPDGTYLPPLLPSGRFMWEFDCLYFSESIMMVRVYLEIFRPFV